MGKAVGIGGPWKDTAVEAGEPSDQYLMTGYDKKSLTLESSEACQITAEIDISGMGDWYTYKIFTLSASEPVRHQFPEAFGAYWIRFRSDEEAIVSAQLVYQ